jgi:hypothetical protein
VRTVAWLAGIGTAAAALMYMVVSLNRWEWNRALFFGLIVLIAEVGLATGLVLRKLGQIQFSQRHPPDQALREILRAARPAAPDRFAWLRESTRRMNVFITFLVGGGVLLSGVAWVVDKVGAKTSNQVGEQRLARQLGSIAYPKGGMLVDDITALAQDVPGADDAQIHKLLRRAAGRA